MRRIAVVLAVGLALGVVALAVYARLGAWPRELAELRAYRASLEATERRPTAPLIGNVRARRTVSLAGTWKALVDPNEAGTQDLLRDLLPRGIGPQGPSDLVEYDFSAGLSLQVPGDWNHQDPRLLLYRGPVWYQRHFEWQRSPGRRLFLYFGAAAYRAEVYLNGRKVASHRGGHTPFDAEVTGVVRDGRNQLVVLVDNDVGPRDVPVRRKDWLDYGGLTRDVLLVEVPETFVQNYVVQLAPGESRRIRGWVRLDGPERRQRVTVTIPELGVASVVETDASGLATLDFAARPERWSPENPVLYRVEVACESDVVLDEIGFRTLEVRGRELWLNGEPLFLRGVSLHAEAPGGRRAQGDADARELLGWVQELHGNFARLAHYPHDEAMLRAADRLGILVWAEIPVYWGIAFDDPDTLALARAQLSELIARDANRASVAFWSIGNETPITPARNRFMAALAAHVRALDDTRWVTAALLAGRESVAPLALRAARAAAGVDVGEWVFPVEDPLGEVLDVVGVNEYIGWYYATPAAAVLPFSSHTLRGVLLEHLPEVRIRTGHDKPLVISEFGAGARAGFHADPDALAVFSEEYQAEVYRRQLAMIARQPDAVGLSPWILKDFRSPQRLHPELQDHWNVKGLLADDGTPKLAFGVLRDHYRERAARERRARAARDR